MLRKLWNVIWFESLYLIGMWFFLLLYSTRTRGRRFIPPRGGFLLVSNHQSLLDPPLLDLATYRRLKFLARKTLFRPPWFGRFIEALGAYPINQEGKGFDGLRSGVELLKQGEGLVVFPEGRRTRDGRIGELQRGILLLIRRAEVPVVPVAIAGAFEAWPIGHRLPRVAPLFLADNQATLGIVIGKPIAPDELRRLAPDQVLDRLSAELHQLQTEAEKLRKRPVHTVRRGWSEAVTRSTRATPGDNR